MQSSVEGREKDDARPLAIHGALVRTVIGPPARDTSGPQTDRSVRPVNAGWVPPGRVIGHILPVAVVVLIGAVIASFAFGMAAGVTRTVAIAVSAHQEGDDIVVTYEGGRDVPSLHALDVTATAEDGTAIARSFVNTPPAVGDVLTLPGAGNPGSDHVVVVAQLVDGSRQVVLDVWV
jgi:FlaG/FlaF family flagellin (archaellin)